ncbi:hypothetical protein ACGFIV_34745, partial [Sphaerisporangium sp. NPDC049003]|uniref:hypothetical protein n=1 Tax=Sphaerisporangium sp. NPDC049003 TaxID=3364517 RepID=UPI003713534E
GRTEGDHYDRLHDQVVPSSWQLGGPIRLASDNASALRLEDFLTFSPAGTVEHSDSVISRSLLLISQRERLNGAAVQTPGSYAADLV